jgi:hypothetical protein
MRHHLAPQPAPHPASHCGLVSSGFIALAGGLLFATPTALAEGPASHWAFDETRGAIAHDSAGGHDGTILGSPTFVRGVAGNALKFSRSTGDRVAIGNVYGNGAPFTVSLWIKIAANAPQDNYPIGSHYAGVVNGWFVFTGTSGGCYGEPNRPSFYATDSCNGDITAAVNVNDGAWHHIACTYTSGGTDSIYVDGGPADASGGASAYVIHPGAQLVIGGLVSGGNPIAAFDGWIDDVQIYSRVLSCAEVSYLQAHPGEEVPNLSDLNDDGAVSGADLAILLGAWGTCGAGDCEADLDCSGGVDAADLAVLLGAWTG